MKDSNSNTMEATLRNMSLDTPTPAVNESLSQHHRPLNENISNGELRNNAEDEMTVKPEELKSLMELFSKTTYKANNTQSKIQNIIQRCLSLFDMDYKYTVIPNLAGELSTNYPSSLVLLEFEKDSTAETPMTATTSNPSKTEESNAAGCSYPILSNLKPTGLISSWKVNPNPPVSQDGRFDKAKIKDMCKQARFARCRARFPIPVIMYNNKHICRSATLSGGPEIYGRSYLDILSGGGTESEPVPESEPPVDDALVGQSKSTDKDWVLFGFVRSHDIRLLKVFKVQTIVDLMVEKKKVKYGLNVTSSEKVDKENRYAEFNLVALPYPGCEFFKQYRDNGYRAEELVFDWSQPHVDADLCIPPGLTSDSMKIDWSHYKDWDLVVLTQRYLKLLLVHMREGESGLLIHCISGWDRTPLFVSLLRLSLWADGKIHKSLDADQILYLTLAYDWLLFGHDLQDRLSKGEEILFFCFNFLKYIVDPEFGVDEPEPMKPHLLSRVRNDSDVHLEGVLLDGEVSQTSPDGSNWSLTSCGSSQSNKSRDHPPAFFQVNNDSWEDCNGAQHLLMSQYHSKNSLNQSLTQTSSNPKLTTNGSLTSSCIITASMINSTPTLPSSSLTSVNGGNGSVGGFNGQVSWSPASPHSPSSRLGAGLGAPKQNGSLSTSNGAHGGRNGRTSPVPVPNRLNSHYQTRPESNSSASIGSWQLINGIGSSRETISTSDPGSGSSHSNPARFPVNPAVDFIEPSQSSCTLVEDSSPIDPKPLFMSSTFKSDGVNGIAVSRLNQALLRDELSLNLDETDSAHFETSPSVHTPDTLTFSLGKDEESTVCTATTTPTKEQDDESEPPKQASPFLNHKKKEEVVTLLVAAQRRRRLDTVRTRFYNLYQGTIGIPSCPAVPDTNGSSGLGSLIGNLATRVGIRSAAPLHRTSHV